MKKTALLLLSLVCVGAQAQGLAPKDRTGVKLASEWMQKPVSPKREENGRVIFQFGATLPTIVCAPFRLCDIALQAGETVRQVRLGDTVRWKVLPAESGPDGAKITHAVVKPTENRLDTTLLISTDRRVYHLRLVSRQRDWMPQVAFEYPEDHDAAWAAYMAKQEATEQAQRRKIVPGVGLAVEDLNFAYAIDGESHWRPVRVFDDGSHTYIDLPREAKHRDAPILLIRDGKEDRLVNYRMHGVRFIVDSLFDEAVLVSGVGSEQRKVIIRRAEG